MKCAHCEIKTKTPVYWNGLSFCSNLCRNAYRLAVIPYENK